MARRETRFRVRVAFVAVTLLFMAVAAESAARLVYAFEDDIKTALSLREQGRDYNVFEMQDPKHPKNWVLKPHIALSFAEVVKSKAHGGHSIGVKRLQEAGERFGLRPDEVVFLTNAQGYKGPAELDASGTLLRILTIGDSCTFGSEIDWWSYPRALERELLAKNVHAEVVNVGVGGYAPWNVKLRLDEFEALRPAWTTVYIGWNALFGEQHLRGPTRWLYAARALESFRVRLSSGIDARTQALAAFTTPKVPDPRVLSSSWLRSYVPTFFGDVVDVVDGMQSAGSRVVIVTIPGLFTTHEPPSERALSIGHLPTTTNNPYVLAAMSERYNQALRALARARSLPLVDLERWANDTLHPRDAYFTDSVHLTEEGQAMIGAFLAEQLLPLLAGAPGAPPTAP